MATPRRLKRVPWDRGSSLGSRRSGQRRARVTPNLPSAFTLIELLIVAAILGILVAVAIPSYQQARSAALVGTIVGELVSYAKACAVINASGVGEIPTPPPPSPGRGGVEITAGCDGENRGATLKATWGEARAEGIPCYSSRSSLTSASATVTINTTSDATCSFAP